MRNALMILIAWGRKSLLRGNRKSGKKEPRLTIEKKWWMGEDLFIDQKPFITNTLKNKPITG